MPVSIAGMHRSGTSMVARLLNLCGLYLGKDEDFFLPGKDNPEGFWENIKFQKVNEEILTSFGGGWDIPPIFEAGWEKSPRLAATRNIAHQLIEETALQPVWGWKDPRNSLTMPFWKSLIPNLKVVICLRNPFDIYQSLARRSYSSHTFSYHLWMVYNQYLLASTKPEDRIVTHYDSFFRYPKSELRRLVDFLELEVSDGIINTACQTISTNLRHHHNNIKDLCATNPPDMLLDLYRELCLRAGHVYGGLLSLDEGQFLKNIAPTEEFVMGQSEKDMESIIQDFEIANGEKLWLQKEIVKLRQETIALQRDIDNIFASHSWRLIQFLQKIRQFFIPLGSRREKIVKAIFNFLSFEYSKGGKYDD